MFQFIWQPIKLSNSLFEYTFLTRLGFTTVDLAPNWTVGMLVFLLDNFSSTLDRHMNIITVRAAILMLGASYLVAKFPELRAIIHIIHRVSDCILLVF